MLMLQPSSDRLVNFDSLTHVLFSITNLLLIQYKMFMKENCSRTPQHCHLKLWLRPTLISNVQLTSKLLVFLSLTFLTI